MTADKPLPDALSGETPPAETADSEHPETVPRKTAISRANECRKFVLSQLRKPSDRIAIGDLQESYNRTQNAIRNDVNKYFRRHGHPVSLEKDHLVYDEGHQTTVSKRVGQSRPEKRLIGELAASLIQGPKSIELEGWSGDFPQELSIKQFVMGDSLKRRLRAYYMKAHRMVILDSGTTTLAIARALVTKVKTPDPERHLNFLRVLTNGRGIAEALDAPTSKHGIILLGGALRRDTEAVAGILAERCLDSWLVRTRDRAFADIAVVGTTAVNDEFDMFSDSEIESEMKSMLLSSARIRCVCADSSKLISHTGGAWAFSAFNPSIIDMIITDSGILPVKGAKAKEEQDNNVRRNQFLDRARETQIHVLVAKLPPPKKHKPSKTKKS